MGGGHGAHCKLQSFLAEAFSVDVILVVGATDSDKVGVALSPRPSSFFLHLCISRDKSAPLLPGDRRHA
jgi:hypothetical protein